MMLAAAITFDEFSPYVRRHLMADQPPCADRAFLHYFLSFAFQPLYYAFTLPCRHCCFSSLLFAAFTPLIFIFIFMLMSMFTLLFCLSLFHISAIFD